ncbi:hypothetical protein [Streptomyces sp. NPDC001594]|uniref:hypothetical protein n=1 Tax=Streptomyces sp. NPDC001594 TaxID=3364590 RepID=UPI00367C7FE9
MRDNISHPAVTAGAAAAVATGGLTAAVILAARHPSAPPAVEPWLLSASAVLGAAGPLLALLVLRDVTNRAALAVFPVAACCHAFALGGAEPGTALAAALVPSIAISVLVCCRASLLHAEETDRTGSQA